MRQKWTRTLLLVTLLPTTLGCPGSLRVTPSGTTYGEIYVDRPEVYTRERLISDRLAQDLWLRQQLDATDKQVFGVQGLADIRSFQGFAASAGIEANPLVVQLQQGKLATELAGLDREEQIAELEHRKSVLELRKQIRDLSMPEGEDTFSASSGEGTTSGSETPATQTQSQSQSEETGGGEETGTTSPTPVTREDSKSFSELFGQAPDAAEARKAGTTASPIDAFRDKLAYREELRAEIIENALDDRHDLGGNTLYRLKFDATVLPENDTSAWAIISVEITSPFQDEDCTSAAQQGSRTLEVYERWSDFMETYVNSEFSRRYYNPTNEENFDLTVKSIEALQKRAPDCPSDRTKPWPSTELTFDLDANLKKLACVIDEKPRDQAAADKAAIEKQRRILVAEALIKQYEKYGLTHYLGIREPGAERLTVKSTSQAQDFCEALKSKSLAYTYAVTPKESVQRISDVASRREATQLSLALGLVLGSVGLDSLTEYAQATEGIFQEVRRQPLVVGFNESANNKPDRFGWILGPRFTIMPNKKGYFFRHSPVQQSLSAVVSVPSWWDGAEITVRRSWRDEKGGPHPASNRKKVQFDIQLPADPSGIAAALATGWKRPPIPISKGSYHLAIGKPGTLVIPGIDLWRNPAVFLGSQKADRIEVLPDMKGIVAHFRSVQQPAGWAPSDTMGKAPIDLWTSEGATYVDDATLHRTRPAAGGVRQVTVGQQRLVGDSIALLRIEQGALPASFASLKVGVRKLLGGRAYADFDPHDIDTTKNVVRVRLTEKTLKAALGSQFAEGVPLQLALKLKLSPAAQTQVHAAAQAPIYYSDAAAASVGITPASVPDLPTKLSLRAPENVQLAYPKFDAAKVTLKAGVKDKPGIRLEVTLTQKGTSAWEAGIAVHPASAAAWAEAHKADQTILLKLDSGSPDLLWKPDSVAVPKGS